MNGRDIKIPSGGVNQAGLRDHNERLVLTLIQRHGALPGSEIARAAGLSAQTISIILRQLESEGLLVRGQVVKGKVGKPSVPMALNPEGAYSYGLKLGRRTSDLVLSDIAGNQRGRTSITYRYPTPGRIRHFLRNGLEELAEALPVDARARIAGIGLATPFELWNWHEAVGAPAKEMDEWRDFDFAQEIARFSNLPVWIENDATAACRAEHLFGRGRERFDYAYFFVGSFIGGGVVLNHSVYSGRTGSAGAFGPVRVPGPGGMVSLIDAASIYLLENALTEAGKSTATLWGRGQDWSGYEPEIDEWLDRTARALASAVVSICAVIDFETVVIDGAFPLSVRARLVPMVREALADEDLRGIVVPAIEEGSVGHDARALGAATLPFNAKYFLNASPLRNA